MWSDGLVHEQTGQKVNQRTLDEPFTIDEEQDEDDEMDDSDNEERRCVASQVRRQPEGYREGATYHHDDDNKYQDDEQCQCRQQADSLVNNVYLQIFLLKSKVVLDNLRKLGNGLYVLVATEHHANR